MIKIKNVFYQQNKRLCYKYSYIVLQNIVYQYTLYFVIHRKCMNLIVLWLIHQKCEKVLIPQGKVSITININVSRQNAFVL